MPGFQLEIVTPEKTFYSGVVEHLQAPGSEGSFGVLSGHVPMLSGLQIGQISFAEEGGVSIQMAASGGFVEVQRDRVIILAETAEFGEEIDVARAQAARDRALEHLSREQDIDKARAQIALSRALNRLKVSGGP
jgi:F-type H+-transporting ATPase subunit epsilon